MGHGVNACITLEIGVVNVVVTGESTASQMNISSETIRMHRKSLYLKLEVGSVAPHSPEVF